MENLPSRFFNSYSFFFFLNAFHEFFCFWVLTRHDICNAQISKYYCCDVKKSIHLFSHEWLVVPNGIYVLVFLLEKDMSHIEFPDIVLRAKLCWLTEDLFYLGIISHLPVDLGLHHENRDILVKCLVILLKGLVDSLWVSCYSCILDLFGLLSQCINVGISKNLKFLVGFFSWCLGQDKSFKEIEIFLSEALISEISIFRQNISSKIIMLILAVQ